jgi:hypothetical protein
VFYAIDKDKVNSVCSCVRDEFEVE